LEERSSFNQFNQGFGGGFGKGGKGGPGLMYNQDLKQLETEQSNLRDDLGETHDLAARETPMTVGARDRMV
jgi:hypothetical protein